MAASIQQASHTMIHPCEPQLPAIAPSDFVSMADFQWQQVFDALPSGVLALIRPLSDAKSKEINDSVHKLRLEPDVRCLGPGAVDIFALPGNFRRGRRLTGCWVTPRDEVSRGLLEETSRHPREGEENWVVSPAWDYSYCITGTAFLAHWEELCGIVSEGGQWQGIEVLAKRERHRGRRENDSARRRLSVLCKGGLEGTKAAEIRPGERCGRFHLDGHKSISLFDHKIDLPGSVPPIGDRSALSGSRPCLAP